MDPFSKNGESVFIAKVIRRIDQIETAARTGFNRIDHSFLGELFRQAVAQAEQGLSYLDAFANGNPGYFAMRTVVYWGIKIPAWGLKRLYGWAFTKSTSERALLEAVNRSSKRASPRRHTSTKTLKGSLHLSASTSSKNLKASPVALSSQDYARVFTRGVLIWYATWYIGHVAFWVLFPSKRGEWLVQDELYL